MGSLEGFNWRDKANFHMGRLFPGCGMEGDRRKILAATFIGSVTVVATIETYQITFGEGLPVPFTEDAVIKTDRSSIPFMPKIETDGAEKDVTDFAIDAVREGGVSPYFVARSIINVVNAKNNKSK